MAKPKWVLICDESGAKGFTDKPAVNSSEQIGVVAGVLLAVEDYDELVKKLPVLEAKYRPAGNTKLHVTDLEVEKQEALRTDVFDIIKHSGGRIVYEALTQDGVHKWYLTEKKYWEKLKSDGKERGYGYSFSDHKKRLHGILFQGCFNRALAYIEDTDPTGYKFSIEMLSDEIDDPIVDEIKTSINHFLSFELQQKKEVTAKRFNYESNEVEEASGTIGYSIKMPDDYIVDLSGVEFDMKIDNECGLLADVIANSVLYHIKGSFLKEQSIVLTSDSAIAEHPLCDLFVGLTEEGGYDLNQSLFSFPVDEKEIDSDEMREPSDFVSGLRFAKK